MDNLNIFTENNELDDLKNEFLASQELSATSASVANVADRFQSMKIGTKINLDKLPGIDVNVDISKLLDSFARLGVSVGWGPEILGGHITSYLLETALLIWKNMKTNRNVYKDKSRTVGTVQN